MTGSQKEPVPNEGNGKMKKKLNKIKISILVILVMLTLTVTVFGRYIYNRIREAYFIAEQFYFTSNILTVDGSEYQYNNWGGSSVYAIEFELRSYTNELTKIDYNLGYTVTCTTSDTDKIRIRTKF